MLPKVILVDIVDPRTSKTESAARLNELESLVNTYGGFVIIRKIQRRHTPDYQTYVGKGKVQELLQEALEKQAGFVIVNNILKPGQLYNLEKIFETHRIKVWDRVDLILKIFAKHATTREAKLQIELASLKHLGPRTVKMGLELSRQGGGIGTSGQGETNIEVMRRHIASREHKIREELKGVEKIRETQRSSRNETGFKTVAIVGYTNAGKSQLMVSLTKKDVKVKNELFATLDSRIGSLYLPDLNKSCLVSDTIGFIRDLPPELIDAFHSTLAETMHADLILHVIDVSDPEMPLKIKVVTEVLERLNCGRKKTIYVFNKIDLKKKLPEKTLRKKFARHSPAFISALAKTNLSLLKSAIAACLEKAHGVG